MTTQIKKLLTYSDVENAVKAWWGNRPSTTKVFGIPRGGTHIALMLNRLGLAVAVDRPDDADEFVDDVIASGGTFKAWMDAYPGKQFSAPFIADNSQEWLIFPWEVNTPSGDGQDIVTRMLQFIGEDTARPGLLETPKRVVKSWNELYAGYSMDAGEILSKQFDSDNSEMVICKDIEFYSMCEHHILPIIGKAHIGYIPNGKVVGLSKLARLVEVFARRLQIQEQMTQQIADAIAQHIPGIMGVGVVIEAKHLCMSMRGVKKQTSWMTTSALLGSFRQHEVRAEFLELVKPGRSQV